MESQQIEFFEPRSLGERDWGEELLVAQSPHYTMKRNTMRAGTAGGLQYHRRKDEAAFIVSGSLWLDFDPGDGKLHSIVLGHGLAIRIPPGAVHRMRAITDVVYFEVSTPHHNDRVRCEARYAEPEVEGLPTTSEDEIEILG